MKVLWLVNVPLPEVEVLMGGQPSPYGGWLVTLSKVLSYQNNVELIITFPFHRGSKIPSIKGDRIIYYSFDPISERSKTDITENLFFLKLLANVNPDIVHVHGTEYPHSLAMVNACTKLGIPTVVSIQGLVSIYAKHYVAGLPLSIQVRYTLRDLIRQDNILQQKKKFYNRGVLEIQTLQMTRYVIGRTTWDRACTNQINPIAEYSFCNEILREEFYKYRWVLDNCERYSLFISQASYPIKGLHFVLEALSIVIKKFPNTRLYIAGGDIFKADKVKQKLKISSYAKYIIGIIKKYNLRHSICFTGLLNEEQMCQRYLKSHIFICPSSIENSPNSLGEAMLLGVPCVASSVGGVPDMLIDKKEGFLYQHDAPYMLAYYISKIFESNKLALRVSHKSRERAIKTHNIDVNTNRLINIYNKIVVQEKRKADDIL